MILNSPLVSDKIEYVLTDIEGTTTSISFVYDVLFPYFREHIWNLRDMTGIAEVENAFAETKAIVLKEDSIELKSTEEIIEKLNQWCKEDRKITPLKTLQGLLWKIGYEQGVLKGHVYDDVPIALDKWYRMGLKMGVFSSGSVEAQKLIFGFSEKGDLSVTSLAPKNSASTPPHACASPSATRGSTIKAAKKAATVARYAVSGAP